MPDLKRPALQKKGKGIQLLIASIKYAFVASHIPLGIIMSRYEQIATFHSLLTTGIGLWFAVKGNIKYTLMMLWYISVSEVLWRMTGGNLSWEYSKYACTLVALSLVVRRKLFTFKQPYHLLYFALLIPSIFAMDAIDFRDIRFNLSGPMCMTAFMILLRRIRMGSSGIEETLFAIIPPAVAVAAIATFSTLSAETLQLSQSSSVTSGGFGPNQVSTTIGAGIYACLVLARLSNRLQQLVLVSLSLWLIGQCLLTFSRGGIWTTGIALCVLSFGVLRSAKARRGVIIIAPIVGFAINIFLLPFLNSITGNSLSDRFADTSSTGRYEMLKVDIEVFADNPFLGVGPGGTKIYHESVFHYAVSHTEQTRMLAEHGMLGVIALLLLLWMIVVRCFDHRQTREATYLKLSMASWGLFYMIHAAFRASLPGLMIAFSMSLPIVEEDNQLKSPEAKSLI